MKKTFLKLGKNSLFLEGKESRFFVNISINILSTIGTVLLKYFEVLTITPLWFLHIPYTQKDIFAYSFF